jgi:predicted  nucleic acid-binding Zn-ribbon protein
VHAHVQKLLLLQKVDQEISSLTKDIDSLPAEEAKRKKRLDEIERQAAERKARLLKTEVESRTLDTSVRGRDDEIKRLNERLNSVRNNAEYQATLFQIEAVRRERDSMQDEGLRLLEAVEQQRVEAAGSQAANEEERKGFEAFLAEAEQLRGSRAGAIAEARARRQVVAHGIPPELLSEYEGLYKTRNHLAVAAVEGSFCQGCYNKITVNDTARLMGGATIVRCGSCQRILYLDK